jgi:hypothetical protein
MADDEIQNDAIKSKHQGYPTFKASTQCEWEVFGVWRLVSKRQTIPLHLYNPRPAKMQLRVNV